MGYGGGIKKPNPYDTIYKVCGQNRCVDKVIKGGGVFLAIKHTLNPVIQPDFHSDAEVVWAKIDISGLKNVFVCYFYKPKENDQDSITCLESSP